MTTPDHGPRAELLLGALAAGSGYRDAATIAGVSLSTVTRRMRDTTFRTRVEQARAEHVERVCSQLSALSGKAVEALDELLSDPLPSIRVRAAALVLAEARAHREPSTREPARLELSGDLRVGDLSVSEIADALEQLLDGDHLSPRDEEAA